jgi:DNA-binding MltR family transcriptional regulator
MLLEAFIGITLRPMTKQDKDRLFVDTGIFPSLYHKIFAAYALGLIGNKARKDLDIMRRIRNVAAHSIGLLSFSDPPICDILKSLSFSQAPPSRIYFKNRSRKNFGKEKLFFIACMRRLIACLCLTMQHHVHSIDPNEGDAIVPEYMLDC